MSQTSYAVNADAGFEGLKATGFDPSKVESLAAEVAIPYGKLVVKGTADGQGKLPTADTDILNLARGVAISSQSLPSSESGAAQYPIKDEVPVLRVGVAWVKVEEAVVKGDAVVVRHAAGGLGLGSFAKTDDADHALLSGAKYLTSASANGLAQVEFNLP